MLSAILSFLSSYALVFVLHVMGAGTFPKPLSPKQEQEQLRLLKEGDRAARNTLIEHNLRLVAHIVKKYSSGQSDQDDLVSIGTIGLIKAIDTFDSDKKIRLSSYASRCIENEILMFFRSQKKTALDVSLDESIDTDKDGNPLTLMDILSCDDNIAEKLETKINIEKAYKEIDSLPERERRIIVMRYGLYGGKPLTQKETAEKLNISRSYVSRIEKKTIALLCEKIDHK